MNEYSMHNVYGINNDILKLYAIKYIYRKYERCDKRPTLV